MPAPLAVPGERGEELIVGSASEFIYLNISRPPGGYHVGGIDRIERNVAAGYFKCRGFAG